MNKVLECSSKGDKRFSALFAKIKVWNEFDSIEGHYQKCKVFLDANGNYFSSLNWKEVKEWQKEGMRPVKIILNGVILPIDYLSSYYKLLWVKYLDANKGLVEYAKQFDEFTDMFRGKNTINCQADVIRQYVKEGRESIMKECMSLIRILNKRTFVLETEGDLLCSHENIIGHQVNCQGVMGAGLARHVKEKYPNVFEEYKLECQIYRRERTLMGKCQLVKVNTDKWIANLFGQYQVGTVANDRVDNESLDALQKKRYEALKQSLYELKSFAQQHHLSVALPYQLGSGLAGGSWEVVRQMIEEVFHDYYVTIYKLPNH